MRMHINEQINVKLAVIDDDNLYNIMIMFSQQSLHNKGHLRIHIPISSASLVDHAYSSSIFLQSSLSKFSQRIVIAKWNKTACKSCSEGLKSDMKLYFPWSDDNLSGRTLVYYAFTMPKS